MSRKFLSILLPLTLAVSLLLGACATPAVAPTQAPAPTAVSEATPTAAPIVLTDALGREVTLAAPATRIISLAASNTEIVFALNAGGALIGRDDFSDYPAEALNVPSIGSLYPNVNAEVIVDLNPDLVLAAGITNPDDVNALAELGLTVYATSFAVTLDDIYTDILAIGALTGHAGDADQLVTDLRARVEAVTTKTASLTGLPKVFYEIDATDPAKPYTAGSGTFIDQLLTMAGGANVGQVGADPYFQISLEELVAQDPAVIILGSATYGGQTPELVAQRAGWEGLMAVKNGAVYTFDDNLVSRPGPRVVDGLEALAKLIHPDLFK